MNDPFQVSKLIQKADRAVKVKTQLVLKEKSLIAHFEVLKSRKFIKRIQSLYLDIKDANTVHSGKYYCFVPIDCKFGAPSIRFGNDLEYQSFEVVSDYEEMEVLIDDDAVLIWDSFVKRGFRRYSPKL